MSYTTIEDDKDLVITGPDSHPIEADIITVYHMLQEVMESCSKFCTVIDVNEVIKEHHKVVPNLLAAHALTGCDTVSSFASVWKTTGPEKKLELLSGMFPLGDLTVSTDYILNSCLAFICKLYGHAPQIHSTA